MLYLWNWNHSGHELEIEPWSTGETKNQAILPLQHQATSVVLDVCLFVFGDGGQMERKDEKSLTAEPGPCVHCSGTAQLKLCPAVWALSVLGAQDCRRRLSVPHHEISWGVRELMEAGIVQGSSLDVS